MTDEHGTVRIAAIATYGDTRHTLVDRSPLRRPLPARLRRAHVDRTSSATARRSGCSRRSTTSSATSSSARWTSGSAFYNRVMGFVNMAEFIGDDIATDYSALMSKVVANGNHRVKFPLNEPAIAKKKSQIDEFLEFYDGPGAQHLGAGHQRHPAHVDAMRAEGVEFLDDAGLLLRRPGAARPDRRGAGADRGAAEARHPGRPRRGRLPAADLHQADRRPARRCSSS